MVDVLLLRCWRVKREGGKDAVATFIEPKGEATEGSTTLIENETARWAKIGLLRRTFDTKIEYE